MDGKNVQKALLAFLVYTAGTVMLQLVAPLLLGIFVNVASFSIPFAIYYLFIAKKWKIKIIRQEEAEQADTEEKGKQPCNTREKQKEGDSPAYDWYMAGGRERIERIASNIFASGKKEFWIRTDGICNIRTQRGYRRFGNLPGYPGTEAGAIAAYLIQDGFRAANDGRYIHVSMQAGGMKHNDL